MADLAPPGAVVRGTLDSRACAACGHQHRCKDTNAVPALTVVYDIACPECGCTASLNEYENVC